MVVEHRYVVLGAGPAGLQLAYFLGRRGADYLVVEREEAPGSFFSRYPRHRRLISLNKVHVDSEDPEIRLRWDWNSLLNDDPDLLFPEYSREYFPSPDDLRRYLADFQVKHGLNVAFGMDVVKVRRVDSGYELTTRQGATVRCAVLVVAAGWGGPHVPDVPGIEHATGYEHMDVRHEPYAGKRVLVVGKGNSAFETAAALLGHASMVHLASPRPIRLAWNTKHPGDVRGMYGAFLDSYQFKTLHSLLDCEIRRIAKDDDRFLVDIVYTHADGETATLEYDAVLRCTGFTMDTGLFEEKPETVRAGRLPAVTPAWESANLPDLFFAGTLMQARDFKRASSAFIDGFRYNLRTLDRLLAERYDGVPLPYTVVEADPDVLTGAILDRVNWSSALWTQFEYLCDALVFEGDRVAHYEDLPEDYAVERFNHADTLVTVTLRWGREDYPDVFAVERHPVPERAAESAFIHPVVRLHHRGRQVGELHLLEDLLAQWRREDRHVAPLRAFLKEVVAGTPPS
ncbi:Thioredoxin reductase [Sinosporangium album]|uniref:Thioredoxin reductase n=1 Tax=Sinosporangium album TaxID=504805 RepID=A0A1G7RZC9_9ACTN|nr:NAD(P)-binding domain-containing protein [Sinosporangium album]SDG16125.1 Thioredoxin reductase [Sinosporangium album]